MPDREDVKIQVGVVSNGPFQSVLFDPTVPKTVYRIGDDLIEFKTSPERIPMEKINTAVAALIEEEVEKVERIAKDHLRECQDEWAFKLKEMRELANYYLDESNSAKKDAAVKALERIADDLNIKEKSFLKPLRIENGDKAWTPIDETERGLVKNIQGWVRALAARYAKGEEGV